ncbi:MAG: hypothetical protein H6Q13_1965 [Bacteroidetes bacterium]|nr:hypothetical protein [Bacteroidota bacterium]
MELIKEQIRVHAHSGYSSSPHEFTDEQLDFIIAHDSQCDNCGKSIYEMCDFPEVLIDKDELLCEECYDDEYRTTCPLCEEYYEKEDMTDYFFITKDISKQVHKPVGMYKILKYPFYYGDCISGFDAFFDDVIEKVSDLNIEEAYSIINPNNKEEVLMDCICPDCAEKYLRKDYFIKAEPYYCLLMPKERNRLFKDYSDELLHRKRQDMIHRRITFRGLLQKANVKRP